MRVLSIAVNTATCERLFSGLGLIHTAKRNRMAASKALDFHLVAKHVRQRAQKDAAAFESPKKKLLISPKERQIIHDTASILSLFTPSPQQRGAVNAGEYSDSEDPGALSLWGEFLDEVFEDEEIDAVYEVTSRSAANVGVSASRDMRELSEVASDEFEEIGGAVEQPFVNHNDRTFPQEAVKLREFREKKAKLGELFE
ncbi:hypothetical protein JG687_00013669 [Phytophthora cactorum]|uniref:HAT C-terminal dimerisation domain-containing protein n=1 Tax=Phytophthora cactorum TaxID=29920 RepID=A0A8T1U315_9STRA|nr:hypothetical protein JG687_00013669 [Phytophthora cactorum]